jgi:two-component system, NtrC family, response regulator GlrR
MGEAQPTLEWDAGMGVAQRLAEYHRADDGEQALRVLRMKGRPCQQEDAHGVLRLRSGVGQLIGESPAFLAAVAHIPTLAHCDATVLISGETGTGKEVCARAIHALSTRAPKPFVTVNCGAIPADLVENELFGHERGAYTDATFAKPGLIQEAEGGTLFLDEIDCLPLMAQVKLLRFLQEKEYRPLGSVKTKSASVRVIAATNANLEDALRQGRLRQDLYYRINVLSVALPPLRHRQGDVVLLAQHFLAKFAMEFAKPVLNFSPEALQTLLAYSWPGNVRELAHTVERAVALTNEVTLREIAIANLAPPQVAQQETLQQRKKQVIAQFEQAYLKEIMLTHDGNITKAAQAAGKNRRAFWQLLRKYDITSRRLTPPK